MKKTLSYSHISSNSSLCPLTDKFLKRTVFIPHPHYSVSLPVHCSHPDTKIPQRRQMTSSMTVGSSSPEFQITNTHDPILLKFISSFGICDTTLLYLFMPIWCFLLPLCRCWCALQLQLQFFSHVHVIHALLPLTSIYPVLISFKFSQ